MHTLARGEMRTVPFAKVHQGDIVLPCDVLDFFVGLDGVVVSV